MANRNSVDLSSYLHKYDYTAYLSRRDWAYEYLRRVPAFEKAAWAAQAGVLSSRIACHNITTLKMKCPHPEAEAWGLKFFPSPAMAAPRAHVFWIDEAHSEKVLMSIVDRLPGEVDATYDTTVRDCDLVHLTDEQGWEHLVVHGNGCSVQVKCRGKSLLTLDPVKATFTVDSHLNIEHQTRILNEATRIYGDQPAGSARFTRKTEILRNGLIALDGIRAGLSDRQIAWIIFGKETVQSGIANGDRSLTQRVKTYRDNANALCEGGYREFLVPEAVASEVA